MTPQSAIAWIAQLFDLPAEAIHPETRREDIPTWDSLGMLTLIARLDEDFQILLPESDLDRLKGISDVLDVLQANGCLQGSRGPVNLQEQRSADRRPCLPADSFRPAPRPYPGNS